MSGLGSFDARDFDREMMGESRSIVAIEPIKGDAVFVTDFVCRVDGQRANSGLILAIPVLFQIGPSRELSLIDPESFASVA